MCISRSTRLTQVGYGAVSIGLLALHVDRLRLDYSHEQITSQLFCWPLLCTHKLLSSVYNRWIICILVCAIITINMTSYSTQQGAAAHYNVCTYCTVVCTVREKCVSESAEVRRCDGDGTCGERQTSTGK